jgi:uncharacterized protein DUF4185
VRLIALPIAHALCVALVGVVPVGCGGTPSSFGATATPLGTLNPLTPVQGRDGGQSGLAFGRSVWSFGDTFLNTPDANGQTLHGNSWSFTSSLSVQSDTISGFSQVTDSAGAPTFFIAPTADEAAYNTAHYGCPCQEQPCGARWAAWPGPPLWDAQHGQALIFYGLVHAQPGNFNFYGVGQSIAIWTDWSSSPQRPVVSPSSAHPTLLFGENDPPWGTGALVEGDELYAFACETGSGTLSPPCSLARVPTAQALDRSAWTFYDGSEWSASMSSRATLFTGAPTITVELNRHLNQYTVVYAQPMSNNVVIRTAPSLVGPWSDERLLFVADKPGGNAYDAVTHSEYEEEDGKILYVTFSRSNGVGWFGSDFALVKVTLP